MTSKLTRTKKLVFAPSSLILTNYFCLLIGRGVYMEYHLKKTLLVTSLIFSFNAQSAINCFGNVSNVYVAKSGEVVLHTTWRKGYHGICSLNGDWKGVTAEVCKGWLSIAQTAQVTKSQTVMRYSLSSCNEVATYSNAQAPEYLMLYGL